MQTSVRDYRILGNLIAQVTASATVVAVGGMNKNPSIGKMRSAHLENCAMLAAFVIDLQGIGGSARQQAINEAHQGFMTALESALMPPNIQN